MNILSNLDEIANLIIRPARYTYKVTDLGNKSFKIDDKSVNRHDFDIKNPRDMTIKCSVYSSSEQLKDAEQVLIYLHCNSGCRVQGLAYLKLAIQNHLTYVVFDFTGSGISDGKYVSLGFYETIDLECIYQHLRQIVHPKAKMILWGRSMGAVTAINFLLKRKYQVFLAIFDSPFRSLRELFVQIGRQKTSFPDFILQMAYNYLKPVIEQKAGFNIEEVDLNLQNNTINNPGIFIASKQDTLVPFAQIDEIFKLYKGQKQMLFIDQGHNEARNIKLIKQVFRAIRKRITHQEVNRKIRVEKQIENLNYFSAIPQKIEKKELSRQKLELTIKSISHRQLLSLAIGKVMREEQDQESLHKMTQGETQKQRNHKLGSGNKQRKVLGCDQTKQRTETLPSPKPTLQKKPISCLLPHKKCFKILSIQQSQNHLQLQQSDKRLLHNNKSESKLLVKRKPFQIKNFFGNQNSGRKQYNHKDQKDRGLDSYEDRKQVKVLGQKAEYNMQNGPLKNCSAVYSHKPIESSPSEGSKLETKLLRAKRNKLFIQERQQPQSDIKNQSLHVNKINFHQDFVKQKEFLKRCQSLEKVFKVKQNSAVVITSKNISHQNNQTHTYRQIKCTERVLEKIIEKQEKKLLILNVQAVAHTNRENQRERQKPEGKGKERKTLQHINNKKPPFVELKGIKNFRNSLESKYKTQIRK